MADNQVPAEFLFSLTATTATGIAIPGGPQGSRVVVPVTGGNFEGPRLRGSVEPSPGGDWITGRADGLQLRTAPLFEAGDERYAWLNTLQAVGIGTSKSGSVSYQVYALTV